MMMIPDMMRLPNLPCESNEARGHQGRPEATRPPTSPAVCRWERAAQGGGGSHSFRRQTG